MGENYNRRSIQGAVLLLPKESVRINQLHHRVVIIHVTLALRHLQQLHVEAVGESARIGLLKALGQAQHIHEVEGQWFSRKVASFFMEEVEQHVPLVRLFSLTGKAEVRNLYLEGIIGDFRATN